MAKEIDFPPVWLAGFAALGGAIGRVVPVVTPVNDILGAALIFAGLALMIVAAGQMLIARTSVIPRRDPDAFVHGGVFRLSRNPIYLADTLLLIGLSLSLSWPILLPCAALFAALPHLTGRNGSRVEFATTMTNSRSAKRAWQA